jgi:hypothetical protein
MRYLCFVTMDETPADPLQMRPIGEADEATSGS